MCCQMIWHIFCHWIKLCITQDVSRCATHHVTLLPNICDKLFELKYPLHVNGLESTETRLANDWNFMFWLSCFFMEGCTDTATAPAVSNLLRSQRHLSNNAELSSSQLLFTHVKLFKIEPVPAAHSSTTVTRRHIYLVWASLSENWNNLR